MIRWKHHIVMLCQVYSRIQYFTGHTSNIHPVNIAERGDPAVHLVLQVEELGVRQLAQLSYLWPGSQSTGSRGRSLTEDIIKTIVHCLGLQWKMLFNFLFKFKEFLK